jgi:hypothetical protein
LRSGYGSSRLSEPVTASQSFGPPQLGHGGNDSTDWTLIVELQFVQR